MTNLKALSKACWALLLYCCCCSNTQADTNPWAGGDYTDIAAVAQMWLDAGYNIDEYFYSEGYSTGSDGTLGNEFLCIRDDTNQVYFGREDVCSDRQMSSYGYIHLDQNFNLALLDTSSITVDTNLITNVFDTPTGGEIQTTWDGCYTISYDNGGDGSWNGTSGGSCPNIGINSGAIRWGYIQQTLSQTFSINEALKAAGIEVDGYNYRWTIKNADGNFQESNGCCGRDDPFYIEIAVLNDDGEKVYSKIYNYSYEISDWTLFTGSDTFAEGLSLKDISEIELNVTGRDAGFWAGYYGPEFRDYKVDFRYRVTPQEDTTIEDLLFQQQCDLDPTYSYLCAGYQDAMLARISTSTTQEIVEDTPAQTETQSESQPEEPALQSNELAVESADSVTETQEMDTSSDESTESNEEVAAEELSEKEEIATTEENKSSGLSANQLSALNNAQAVSNAATAIATEQSQTSAGIGLSESGGVSSALLGDLSIAQQLDSVSAATDNSSSTSNITASEPNNNSTTADTTSSNNTTEVATSTSDESSNNSTDNNDSFSVSLSMSATSSTTAMSTDIDSETDPSASASSSVSTELEISFNTGSDYNDNQGIEQNFYDSSTELEITDSIIEISVVDDVSASLAEIIEISVDSDFETMSYNSSEPVIEELLSQDTTFSTAESELDIFNIAVQSSNEEQSSADAEPEAVENNDITGELALDLVNELNEVSFEAAEVQSVPVVEQLDFVGRFITDFLSSLPEVTEPEEEEEVDEDLEAFKEAVLVAKAQSGDDNEDAKAALLGYNPAFSAYLTDQMSDGKMYQPEDIYDTQQNYDNPSSRLFNGASDLKHEQLIELQYNR